jgi:hypothetical protein
MSCKIGISYRVNLRMSPIRVCERLAKSQRKKDIQRDLLSCILGSGSGLKGEA